MRHKEPSSSDDLSGRSVRANQAIGAASYLSAIVEYSDDAIFSQGLDGLITT